MVNYIYRCGTWWEVGKLTYMVAALPHEKISCFFLCPGLTGMKLTYSYSKDIIVYIVNHTP